MIWPPLPVVGPMLAAAGLAILGKRTSRRVADWVAITVAAADTVLTGWLVHASSRSPIVTWMGGWTPHAQVALGIAFTVTPIGAGLACLSSALVTLALVYSIHFFDAAGSLFHVLMLVFLAALCGFGLTGDLFDLFVFFELMSAAAVALCGYKSLEAGPVQGAINFGVTNAVGAFLALLGIGLLYGRTGALNFSQIGLALGGRRDGLVLLAFSLISCGFLVKAAAVPFQFWLPDAHAVAPTPVSVLFSGVMVEAGLYAVARVYSGVFLSTLAPALPHTRALLTGLGALTAVVGGLMCLAQHHLKRLLAFSTVSHAGLILLGIGLLDGRAWGGASLYVLGHGAIKAALFLLAGVLLHAYRTVNELQLHGRARRRKVLAILWALGGLGLAGFPFFGTFAGEHAVDEAAHALGYAFVPWIFFVAGALTGAAVLRAGARIFLGWGHAEPMLPPLGGLQTEQPETPQEAPATPWTMMFPAALLLGFAIVLAFDRPLAEATVRQAAGLLSPNAVAHAVLEGGAVRPPSIALARPSLSDLGRGVLTTLGAAGLGALLLLRPRRKAHALWASWIAAYQGLRRLHSGRAGDYVAWLTLGVGAFSGLALLLLR